MDPTGFSGKDASESKRFYYLFMHHNKVQDNFTS